MLHVVDFRLERVMNLGYALASDFDYANLPGRRLLYNEEVIAFAVSEYFEQADLNGDGDLRDSVLHILSWDELDFSAGR